jgi:hypothetical protein
VEEEDVREEPDQLLEEESDGAAQEAESSGDQGEIGYAAGVGAKRNASDTGPPEPRPVPGSRGRSARYLLHLQRLQ